MRERLIMNTSHRIWQHLHVLVKNGGTTINAECFHVVIENHKSNIYIHVLLLGFQLVPGFSTVGSKFLSIACRAQMVSAGDNGVYTSSVLLGVIPYVQCIATVFLHQVCS
jgi:hypothetical protein